MATKYDRSASVGAGIGRIRNPSKYGEEQWNLDIFDGCFPGASEKFAGSDVDGAVWSPGGMWERRDHFLFMEFSEAPKNPESGQYLALQALARKPGMSVILVEGAKHQPRHYEFLRGETIQSGDCDLPRLRDIVYQWFVWADRGLVDTGAKAPALTEKALIAIGGRSPTDEGLTF